MDYDISYPNWREIDPQDDNIDIEVVFDGGNKYVATFFTLENIIRIRKHYESSGECCSGLYFWASDMIIIDRISEPNIRRAVDDLIKSGEFGNAFTRIDSD